ncbi:glucose-1-phosphate cytidylyltransferase [Paenibacillus oryzisoli]|uniref:Glucose-1-phosphate cytidylyltransferase n=1 Tax=Paenibacillus oryzisoli TaxID=1850517 RepID=A0A197ZZI5_9BACL|nr:glucose-1-phosphate cytidylyltransferase [Paenibacillus oryzisoli]OAS14355.1 glucose-1-phosphate cytidylyltransferase [Paenibacillus oryzisoli]
MTKVVILCGGLGTRLAEETHVKPKPLVEIGGLPILVHIMKLYGSQGFGEFELALGYKGEMIKHYMLHYSHYTSDLTIDMRTGAVSKSGNGSEDWIVHLTDTGERTMTGGRLRRLRSRLGNETFMMTYGDGVGDINLRALLDFHRSHGKLATVTTVRPPGRFGTMLTEGDQVKVFQEKRDQEERWINGGFFVLEPQVLDYIEGDADSLESDVLDLIARDGQLMAYRHEGFWSCMDTIRDHQSLEALWATGEAPWKVCASSSMA